MNGVALPPDSCRALSILASFSPSSDKGSIPVEALGFLLELSVGYIWIEDHPGYQLPGKPFLID